ncbi:hypothetical protein KEM56_007458 [Ascosphaera pollenicola]|nr:hypothetical protein KEM56_007458 [Ascosphaera pollenicola]
MTGASDTGMMLSEAYSSDSWVEVSSRPSTSSMSSSVVDEEEGIVTMGLQVQQQRRQDLLRRRARLGVQANVETSTSQAGTAAGTTTTSSAGTGNSQNAYEQGHQENEDDNEHEANSSDSDHAMSSSTEDLASPTSRDMFFLSRGNSTTNSSASASVISSELDEYDNDDDDDDDMDVDDSDDETALGPTNPSYTRVEGFKPQPHVFSQFTSPTPSPQNHHHHHHQQQQHRSRPNPPSRLSSQTIRGLGTRPSPSVSRPRLAASIVSPGTTAQRPQQQQQQQQPHSPLTAIYPSSARNQDDHDAALRASLSTLLSCARGLASNDVVPQQNTPSANETAAAVVSAAPTTPVPGMLRLVPESVAMARQAEGNERTGRRTETNPAAMKDGQGQGQARATPTATSSRQQSPSSAKKRSAPQTAQAVRASSRQVKRRQSPSSLKRRRTSSENASMMQTAYHQFLSPTILSYIVGGALIVAFSAGFALGRRSGRLESSAGMIDFESGGGTTASAGAVSEIGSGCKREGIRGIWELRKLGWLGTGSSGVRDVASA